MFEKSRLMDLSRAAPQILRTEATLRKWRMEGRFPGLFRRIGGRVLVHEDDLQRLIDGTLPEWAESKPVIKKRGGR